MSSSPMVSEREAVRREQIAAREGYLAGQRGWTAEGLRVRDIMRNACTFASARYPMPSITKPRERTDEYEVTWRVVDGVMSFRYPGNTWNDIESTAPITQPVITSERLSILDDLRANPVETVEEEDDNG